MVLQGSHKEHRQGCGIKLGLPPLRCKLESPLMFFFFILGPSLFRLFIYVSILLLFLDPFGCNEVDSMQKALSTIFGACEAWASPSTAPSGAGPS